MARGFSTIGVFNDLSVGTGNYVHSAVTWVGGDPNNRGTGNTDSIQYNVGDLVVHNGQLWVAAQQNDNVEPADGAAEWTAVGVTPIDPTNELSRYTPGRAYERGDVAFELDAQNRIFWVRAVNDVASAPTLPSPPDWAIVVTEEDLPVWDATVVYEENYVVQYDANQDNDNPDTRLFRARREINPSNPSTTIVNPVMDTDDWEQITVTQGTVDNKLDRDLQNVQLSTDATTLATQQSNFRTAIRAAEVLGQGERDAIAAASRFFVAGWNISTTYETNDIVIDDARLWQRTGGEITGGDSPSTTPTPAGWTELSAAVNHDEALNDLTDVTIDADALREFNFLRYNATESMWVNSIVNLDMINDVAATNPDDRAVLRYRPAVGGIGAAWVTETQPVRDFLISAGAAAANGRVTFTATRTDAAVGSVPTTETWDIQPIRFNQAGGDVDDELVSITLDDVGLSLTFTDTAGNTRVFTGTDAISELDDVSLTNPADGNVLVREGTSWLNRNLDLNDLGDVMLSNPASTEVLTYNGTAWANAAVPNDSVSTLTDTSIVTPTNGQLLTYRDTDNMWVNMNAPEGGVLVEDEGTSEGRATTLNFVGPGVHVDTIVNGVATINISGTPEADPTMSATDGGTVRRFQQVGDETVSVAFTAQGATFDVDSSGDLQNFVLSTAPAGVTYGTPTLNTARTSVSVSVTVNTQTVAADISVMATATLISLGSGSSHPGITATASVLVRDQRQAPTLTRVAISGPTNRSVFSNTRLPSFTVDSTPGTSSVQAGTAWDLTGSFTYNFVGRTPARSNTGSVDPTLDTATIVLGTSDLDLDTTAITVTWDVQNPREFGQVGTPPVNSIPITFYTPWFTAVTNTEPQAILNDMDQQDRDFARGQSVEITGTIGQFVWAAVPNTFATLTFVAGISSTPGTLISTLTVDDIDGTERVFNLFRGPRLAASPTNFTFN